MLILWDSQIYTHHLVFKIKNPKHFCLGPFFENEFRAAAVALSGARFCVCMPKIAIVAPPCLVVQVDCFGSFAHWFVFFGLGLLVGAPANCFFVRSGYFFYTWNFGFEFQEVQNAADPANGFSGVFCTCFFSQSLSQAHI